VNGFLHNLQKIRARALKKVRQPWAVYFLLPPSTYWVKSVCWFHKFCSSNPLHGCSSIFSNIILDSVFHFLCLDCMSLCSFCCHKPVMSLIPCRSDQCSESFIPLEYGNRKWVLVNMTCYNSMATGMGKHDMYQLYPWMCTCQKYLAWNNWIHAAALSHHTAYWQREIWIAGIAPALLF